MGERRGRTARSPPTWSARWVAPHLRQDGASFSSSSTACASTSGSRSSRCSSRYFDIQADYYFSILPTATPYSRNAIFSGLLPGEIGKQHPDSGRRASTDERSKNRYERQLLESQLKRLEASPIRAQVRRRSTAPTRRRSRAGASSPTEHPARGAGVQLHRHPRARPQRVGSLRELAPDEAGVPRGDEGVVHALGAVRDPAGGSRRRTARSSSRPTTARPGPARRAGLRRTATPRPTCATSSARISAATRSRRCTSRSRRDSASRPSRCNKNYILAKEDFYFVYPTKFHEYERQYRGSFQHGGISLEEMILPVATLTPRRAWPMPVEIRSLLRGEPARRARYGRALGSPPPAGRLGGCSRASSARGRHAGRRGIRRGLGTPALACGARPTSSPVYDGAPPRGPRGPLPDRVRGRGRPGSGSRTWLQPDGVVLVEWGGPRGARSSPPDRLELELRHVEERRPRVWIEGRGDAAEALLMDGLLRRDGGRMRYTLGIDTAAPERLASRSRGERARRRRRAAPAARACSSGLSLAVERLLAARSIGRRTCGHRGVVGPGLVHRAPHRARVRARAAGARTRASGSRSSSSCTRRPRRIVARSRDRDGPTPRIAARRGRRSDGGRRGPRWRPSEVESETRFVRGGRDPRLVRSAAARAPRRATSSDARPRIRGARSPRHRPISALALGPRARSPRRSPRSADGGASREGTRDPSGAHRPTDASRIRDARPPRR